MIEVDWSQLLHVTEVIIAAVTRFVDAVEGCKVELEWNFMNFAVCQVLVQEQRVS